MPKDMGGWMDGWVDVRHGRGDSHGRARKVLTDGQNNTQDMLIHKPRIAFKSLFSNLWGSFPKPEFFWQLFFSSDQLHPKEIKHTKKKKRMKGSGGIEGGKQKGFISSFPLLAKQDRVGEWENHVSGCVFWTGAFFQNIYPPLSPQIPLLNSLKKERWQWGTPYMRF